MRCEWALVTGPAQEPLSVAEAKLHLSLTQSDEDGLTLSYLTAGRQAAEQFMSRALFTQTWRMQLEHFADIVWLPMAAPLQSVSSVTYYDGDGTLQTLPTTYYEVDTVSQPGRIVRKPGQSWPTVQCDRLMPVTITYVCGHATTDAIPELVKQGIRLYVGAADTDRQGGIDSEASRRAAEHCWLMAGQVFWREPQRCLG